MRQLSHSRDVGISRSIPGYNFIRSYNNDIWVLNIIMQLPSSVCARLQSTTGTRFRKLGLISQTITLRGALHVCARVRACVRVCARSSSRNFSKSYETMYVLMAVAEGNVRAETRVTALTFRPVDGYGVPHARTLIPEYMCHHCVRHLQKTHTWATDVSENARDARDRARFPHRSGGMLFPESDDPVENISD